MKYFSFFLTVLVFILAGCSSQNGLTKYENTEIVFGSGGGYTGLVIEYNINTDRELTRTNSLTKETIELGKISKGKTKKLYEALSDLKLPLKEFDQPGNMYYYVKQVKGNKVVRVLWGDQTTDIPGGVKDYYDELMLIVQKKNQ